MERRISSQSRLTVDSSASFEDRRFSELMKPIKDLTKNWNLPLAEYLTTYYQEIVNANQADIEIQLDGRTTSINFAHAAMFLQGTASVYSKKVELLWQTVLKMLDTLASKRALEEAEASGEGEEDGSKSGRKKKGPLLDGNSFNLISLEVVRNNDLKLDGENNGSRKDVHSRKMTLKFIFVTPRQLIEKEGKEVKATRINLYDRNGDLIGHKDDFRLNQQFSMLTGMIGEELSHDSELGMQSVSLCDDSVSMNDNDPSNNVTLAAPPSNEQVEEDNQAAASSTPGSPAAGDDPGEPEDILGLFDGDPPGDPPDDSPDADAPPVQGNPQPLLEDPSVRATTPDEEGFHGFRGQEWVSAAGRVRLQGHRDRIAEVCAEEKAPIYDPWKPLDPQEIDQRLPEAPARPALSKKGKASAKAKPIRRGKTTKIPPSLNLEPQKQGKTNRCQRVLEKQGKGAENVVVIDRLRVTVPVEHFLIEELSNGKYKAAHLLGGGGGGGSSDTPPELRDIPNVLKARLKERLEEGNAPKEDAKEDCQQATEDNETPAAPPEAEEGEGADDIGGEDDPSGGGGDDDFELPDAHEIGDAELAAEIPSATSVPPAPLPAETTVNRTSGGPGVDSYEQMVADRVSAYVTQAHDYIQSTELAKRVAKWHESIGPRLEEVEKRGNFDIHDYGTKIIDSLKNNNTTGSSDQRSGVKFSEVAAGQPKEEVARLFLSTLMLANTMNVELKSESRQPMAMDDAVLTLMDETRHHENIAENMFDSPSRPGPSSSKPNKSKRVRKVSSLLDSSSDTDSERRGQDERRKKVQKKKAAKRRKTDDDDDLEILD